MDSPENLLGGKESPKGKKSRLSLWKKLFGFKDEQKADVASKDSPQAIAAAPDKPTETHCPKCGKLLRFPHTDKQARVRCPACKNEFSYPAPEIENYCPFQGCGWPATKGIYCDRHASKAVRNQLNGKHERIVANGEAKAKKRAKAQDTQPAPRSEPQFFADEAKPVSRKILKDQYELLAEVGRGGFGAVYKARDVHLGQFVAVKELILENPEPLKDEAKVLSELRHKNIVGFRQLFPDGGRWYMVMDFVEGGNLAKLISRSVLYDGESVNVLKRMLSLTQQAAEGLAYAHEHGIIHQDVKPANVMVNLKGIAKVSDFGLAKARPQGSGYQSEGGMNSILVSVNGMTPAYCSPEQANRGKVTKKTDTWSWGLSVLEMFTGKVVWRSGTAAREALQQCVQDQAERKNIPPMPQRLVNLLERCFQDEAQLRPDMGEIVKSLADMQGGGNWLKRLIK